MNENTTKGIEVATHVAIIVTAVLLCVVLVKNYMTPQPALGNGQVARTDNPDLRTNQGARQVTEIQPGTKIRLSGVDWAQNGKTLLIAISDKCHFCSESAPFYQRLATQHGKSRLVAVLPQPVEDGKKYLDSLNVTVDEIKQASLGGFGIRGTPTLVLVDGSGAAVKTWVGKLGASQESEVLGSLQ